MSPLKHLVVMAKAPVMGQVKSRLARDVGWVAATQFHRRTLAQTARRLKDSRWRCWLSVSPDQGIFDGGLWPDGWDRLAQGQGDLGQRMLRPWLELPPGPVVIVGSDIPGIQAQHINAAFGALGENDLVFGPATDGGFWLVGAKRRPHVINPFGAVRWSSADAMADTLANAPDGAKIGFVETLSDVDDGESYRALKRGAL